MNEVRNEAVTAIAPPEAERAVATLALAFSSDPGARWTYPDPAQYLAHFPAVVRAFGGKAFEHGTAYRAGGFAGTALWLPPGVHVDFEALGAVMEATVAAPLLAEVSAVFGQMGRYHPNAPHWYLPLLGVDPAHQRKGHGSALLRQVTAQCDRDHTPAYLESSNRANVPLYERHGFKVLDVIQVGASPQIFPMLRDAR
jgi:ribosomal protein S18 acetylase RimI-like enzyme